MKKQIVGVLTAAAVAAAVGAVAAPSANAASSSHCSYTSSQPVLRYGSTGTAVKQLQCELYWSVSSSVLTRDGSFGSATLADVKKFQGCAHLQKDGIVGPDTWASLNYYVGRFAC